jgi:DNA/RNA endonuclease YhcR with UshA esterase domain|tara:strand:+ start:633 stop:851 length:219 start_codon:yes stop_codon:yes gene_type:complete
MLDVGCSVRVILLARAVKQNKVREGIIVSIQGDRYKVRLQKTKDLPQTIQYHSAHELELIGKPNPNFVVPLP